MNWLCSFSTDPSGWPTPADISAISFFFGGGTDVHHWWPAIRKNREIMELIVRESNFCHGNQGKIREFYQSFRKIRKFLICILSKLKVWFHITLEWTQRYWTAVKKSTNLVVEISWNFIGKIHWSPRSSLHLLLLSCKEEMQIQTISYCLIWERFGNISQQCSKIPPNTTQAFFMKRISPFTASVKVT